MVNTARAPLSTGELHALCWAYSRLKRYGPLLTCLDHLESAARGRDKSTLLLGLDDATPTVYLMRAEAFIDLAQWDKAIAQGRQALNWYREQGGSGEKDLLIDSLAALAVAAAFNGDASAASDYAHPRNPEVLSCREGGVHRWIVVGDGGGFVSYVAVVPGREVGVFVAVNRVDFAMVFGFTTAANQLNARLTLR